MEHHHQNVYLVLTKRTDRLAEIGKAFHIDEWWQNVWFGVTAENQEMWEKRVPLLLEANPVHPWVMCEPLLGEIHRPRQIERLHWVVAGKETGAGKRHCSEKLLIALKWDADAGGVPFWGKSGYTDSDRAYPKAMLEWLNK
jgi:protein gp37